MPATSLWNLSIKYKQALLFYFASLLCKLNADGKLDVIDRVLNIWQVSTRRQWDNSYEYIHKWSFLAKNIRSTSSAIYCPDTVFEDRYKCTQHECHTCFWQSRKKAFKIGPISWKWSENVMVSNESTVNDRTRIRINTVFSYRENALSSYQHIALPILATNYCSVQLVKLAAI